MTVLTEAALLTMVVGWLRRQAIARQTASGDVTLETDLVGTGLVDSLGMVDLILYLEHESGLRIDLAEADPAQFTTVRGLCKLVAGASAPAE